MPRPGGGSPAVSVLPCPFLRCFTSQRNRERKRKRKRKRRRPWLATGPSSRPPRSPAKPSAPGGQRFLAAVERAADHAAYSRVSRQIQRPEVVAKRRADLGVLQRQFHRGLEKGLLAVGVVAVVLVLEGVHGLAVQQAGDAVGQLYLAAHALRLVADLLEYRRCQDVAAGHAHARRGGVGLGFFDDALDADQGAAG